MAIEFGLDRCWRAVSVRVCVYVCVCVLLFARLLAFGRTQLLFLYVDGPKHTDRPDNPLELADDWPMSERIRLKELSKRQFARFEKKKTNRAVIRKMSSAQQNFQN